MYHVLCKWTSTDELSRSEMSCTVFQNTARRQRTQFTAVTEMQVAFNGRKWLWLVLMYYFRICLEGIRRATENLFSVAFLPKIKTGAPHMRQNVPFFKCYTSLSMPVFFLSSLSEVWRYKSSGMLRCIDWYTRMVIFLSKSRNFSLVLDLTLKMKTLRFFETSVTVYQSTRRNNPEDFFGFGITTLWEVPVPHDFFSPPCTCAASCS